MAVLNHWALLPRGAASLGAPFADGFVLCGYVEGHPEARGGLVTTSPVMEIAADGTWARTRSRVYGLGEPDAYFMHLLEERGLSPADLLNNANSAVSS